MPEPSPDPSPAPAGRALSPRVVLVAALVAAAAAIPGGRLLKGVLFPPELPVLGAAPSFTLTDQDGRAFSSRELAGRVWIAAFVFTRCPSVCPLLTQAMRSVQDRTAGAGDAVRLVSFTVDPAHDTPAVLAEYARLHGADPARWRFLTGPRAEIEDRVAAGFQVGVAGTGPDLVPEQVVHSSLLLLVDADGRVRGTYDSGQPERLDRLVEDALGLARPRRGAAGGEGTS